MCCLSCASTCIQKLVLYNVRMYIHLFLLITISIRKRGSDIDLDCFELIYLLIDMHQQAFKRFLTDVCI